MLLKQGSSTYNAYFQYDPTSKSNLIEFDIITLTKIAIILDLPIDYAAMNRPVTFPKERFVEYDLLVERIIPLNELNKEISLLTGVIPKADRFITGIKVINDYSTFPNDDTFLYARIDIKKGSYTEIAFFVQSDLIMYQESIYRIKQQLKAHVVIAKRAVLRQSFMKLLFLIGENQKAILELKKVYLDTKFSYEYVF
ncbi:hypothetical protein [Brevibacillus choshinensis]|uniref:hypothetical protein n=1 Tax=Brevibacillus choshinensis TaxID=54911 RepID=UPI002E2195AF|nr:hypothetical protein [Brevibacillus choshinensis]